MPNRWAVATGNWSSTATWNNGAVLGLPTGSDDVFISGSFTVTIDQDINVLSLNNRPSGSGAGAIAAGGSYAVSTTRNIKADINTIGGVSTANTLSITGTGITVNITGSISGSSAAGTIVSITSVSSIINVSGSYIVGTNGGTNVVGLSIGGTNNTVTAIAGSFIGGTGGSGGTFGVLLINGSVGCNVRFVGDMYGGTTAAAIGIAATSPFTASIVGNSFNILSNSGLTISSTGLGTVTMTGSINGGIGSNWFGASITATNLTFNFTGSINGAGAGGSSAYGLISNSGGTNTVINVVGSVNGGAGGSAIFNNTPIIYNITGSVIGGSTSTANAGIINQSTGIINVSGSSIGGLLAVGVSNTSTGAARVTTAVASAFAAGINNSLATGTGSFESAIYASNGTQPWSGFCRLRSSANNFITTATDTGGTKTLVDATNVLVGLPSASDVRLGTSYNFGNNTGTCAVPSASQVAAGIAVDNTVGTAVLTVANVASAVWGTQTSAITESGSIGDRLKNSATVSSTGDQITALIV